MPRSPSPNEVLTFRAGPSVFRAAPSLGARLMDWIISVGGHSRPVLHWPQGADLSAPSSIRGGNPILFPFAGRSFHDGQAGFWRGPDGRTRPMPPHGLARQGRFEVIDLTPTRFLAQFRPEEEAQASFPFRYTFAVDYRFRETSVEVDLSLLNRDVTPIPWCAGHHFYFQLPWHPNLTRSHYSLWTDAAKAWRHASDGSLHPDPQYPKTPRAGAFTSLDHPPLNDRIHTRLRTPVVRFGPRSGEESVALRYRSPLDPWTSLVTWSHAPDAPYYCLEPWMGPPNAPAHGHGLHWVQPGAVEVFSLSIELL